MVWSQKRKHSLLSFEKKPVICQVESKIRSWTLKQERIRVENMENIISSESLVTSSNTGAVKIRDHDPKDLTGKRDFF